MKYESEKCSHSIKGSKEENKSKSNKNNLSFDATEILQQIIGTDVTEIFGITDTNAVEIISEIGLEMSKWPTNKNFTAWLNLHQIIKCLEENY